MGSPPFRASSWRLAGVLLASSWPLASLLASCWLEASPTRISLANRFFKGLTKLVNSVYENACFSMVSVFRGVPLHLGPLAAPEHSWALGFPGLLLASCWPLAGFLLASSVAGFFLASCWLPRLSIPPENRFFQKPPKTCEFCSSKCLFFNGFAPFRTSCWPLGGFLLPSSWHLAGSPPEHPARKSIFRRTPKTGMVSVFRGVRPFGASSWLLAFWPLAVLFLASCWPWLLATRISLANRFFKRLPKLVNSLHENVCFSMVSVFRGSPPFGASCWPVAGFLLASSWPLAGLFGGARRQSSLPKHPEQSTRPEHPARARQSTPPEPPEHPASQNLYCRFAQKNVCRGVQNSQAAWKRLCNPLA